VLQSHSVILAFLDHWQTDQDWYETLRQHSTGVLLSNTVDLSTQINAVSQKVGNAKAKTKKYY
jgi:hypothetical protein